MEIIYGIDNFEAQEPTCVTVGTFDGLHVGHMRIISELKLMAANKGLKSVVLTFDPHPRQVLRPGQDVRFVLSRDEKIEAFRAVGIDYLVIHPFSMDFASLSARDFLCRVMCGKLNMRHLVKGFNNHFGCDRLSDVETIGLYGRELGFGVTKVEAELQDGVSASSTLVRQLVSEGRMEEASAILGYNYFLSGEVVHGKEIGRTIGFPTANIVVSDSSKLLPKNGVYAVMVSVDGVEHQAMLNIGFNPTVNGSGREVFLEVYILNFNQMIYGKTLRVRFLARIRNEQCFPSLSALQRQLALDVDSVKAICRPQ